MKRIFTLLAIISCTLLLSAQEASDDIVKVGDKMPDFSLSSEKYGVLKSGKLNNKVLLINIFATWCGPCQLELAEVQKELWPKYKDNPDFVMLTVGREHTDEELTKYNEKKKFSFPLYPDPKRGFTSKFAVKQIPRTYLVDRNGIIVYMSIGYKKDAFKDLLKKIEDELDK
ncbi:TlpA family protein disulfide reductase [Dysgonomonas sp. OttesenSCG-928-D17]|nr:TlpA family protein disulfide reductase [Dysgonomonas sp. OttesenSCG-928-D17]